MTPKELLGLDAEDIERMSDGELEAIFSPLYHVTRPEFVGRDKGTTTDGPIKASPRKANNQQRLNKALALAAQFGVDIK